MKSLCAFFMLAVISSTLLCCNKSTSSNSNPPAITPPIPEQPAYSQHDSINVAYDSADAKQQYDIYLPGGRSEQSTPVVFFIHGGGWIGGDKSDVNGVIPILRQWFPKYAFVVVNYRLYDAVVGKNRFPAQEQDVKNCIAHVFSNAAKYHISGKFVLWGQSAGAQLATLYAYKYGETTFRPVAVIDQAGPTDMISMYEEAGSDYLKGLLKGVAGNDIPTNSSLFKSSSPLQYISAASSPTLILHGQADEVVPYRQAELLNAGLQRLGVPHVYRLYPGEGHLLGGVVTQVNQEIITFLRQYLG